MSNSQRVAPFAGFDRDHFGWAAARSADALVVGAPYALVQPFPGAALVFEPTAPAWASFCDASDGALACCPCGNPGAPDTGCGNGVTRGARLELLSLTSERAWLQVEGLPSVGPGTFVLLLRSGEVDAAPSVLGDGLLCLAAPVERRVVPTVASLAIELAPPALPATRSGTATTSSTAPAPSPT